MKVPSPFKSYSQPAKLMQPTYRSFDNPPVYSQATAVGSAPLCQNRTDVEASQLLAKMTVWAHCVLACKVSPETCLRYVIGYRNGGHSPHERAGTPDRG